MRQAEGKKVSSKAIDFYAPIAERFAKLEVATRDKSGALIGDEALTQLVAVFVHEWPLELGSLDEATAVMCARKELNFSHDKPLVSLFRYAIGADHGDTRRQASRCAKALGKIQGVPDWRVAAALTGGGGVDGVAYRDKPIKPVHRAKSQRGETKKIAKARKFLA